MDIAVSSRVTIRDEFGRFISACDEAATATVEEVIRKGAALSAAMAPKRSGALAASITPAMIDSRSGHWYSDLKYALPQETGSVPHEITGRVSFFWEREGRPWRPGDNMIHHPGNPATHYLLSGYEIVFKDAIAIADKHYPG